MKNVGTLDNIAKLVWQFRNNRSDRDATKNKINNSKQ